MTMSLTRRRAIVLGAGSVGLLAGCVGDDDVDGPREEAVVDDELGEPDGREIDEPQANDSDDDPDARDDSDDTEDDPEADDTDDEVDIDDPPLAEEPLFLDWDMETLQNNRISTGARIPAIDEPVFTEPDDHDALRFDTGDEPVFGVEINGEAKAYPQHILVWHEIVNDVVGGESIAVTYCPLTGTAQAFERGEAEFAVTGALLNSNLIMYEESSFTIWPQMLATGIATPALGESLREVPVIWTTWDRWRTAYPDTQVLTEQTGYVRNYASDPYGSYGPAEGYYADDEVLFSPLGESDEEHPKEVVIGARTTDAAIAFNKAALLEGEVMTGTLGDTPAVAVAEPELATGYVYANPDERDIEPVDDGTYEVGGEANTAADLPLERVLAYDAMWFAWYGYYPSTDYVD